MKDSNDTNANRIRELPTCSAVPQPTARPHAPINGYGGRHRIVLLGMGEISL